MKKPTKWGHNLKRKIVVPQVKVDGKCTTLSGPHTVNDFHEFFAGNSFDEISLSDCNFIDLNSAEAICMATNIRSIRIWSDVSRAGFSRLMRAEGLQCALASGFAGCGRFRDFKFATSVEDFRSFSDLKSADLMEISNLPNLISLTAQSAEFGAKAMERLASMQTLQQVDFEGVTITDEMAQVLSKSRSITDVVVPATRLTETGLRYISEMPQLRYIDIWANRFKADVLDMFAGHPTLEILELGTVGYDVDRVLHARDIIPKLDQMPKLNTVYFENVAINDEEIAYLNSRFKFRLMQEEH